jgi:hypothetical protein
MKPIVKKRFSLLKVAGIVNIFILSALVLLNIFHALTIYDYNSITAIEITSLVILLIIAIISITFRTCIGYAYLYAAAGLSCAYLCKYDNPIAIFFILFSIVLFNNFYAEAILVFLLCALTAINFIFHHYNIFSFIGTIVLYIGSYTVYKLLLEYEIKKRLKGNNGNGKQGF